MSDSMYYILDKDKKVIPADMDTWGQFRINTENRIMKQEYVDDKFVSTVFIGIDMALLDMGCPPLVFETMVFDHNGKGHDIYCARYPDYEGAMNGHKAAVHWVKEGCKQDI